MDFSSRLQYFPRVIEYLMNAMFDFVLFSDFGFQDLNLPRTNADQFSITNVEEGMIGNCDTNTLKKTPARDIKFGFYSLFLGRDGDIDTILGKLCALESKYKDGTPNSSPRNSTIGN